MNYLKFIKDCILKFWRKPILASKTIEIKVVKNGVCVLPDDSILTENIKGLYIRCNNAAGDYCSANGNPLATEQMINSAHINLQTKAGLLLLCDHPLAHFVSDNKTAGDYAQLIIPGGVDYSKTKISFCCPENLTIPEGTVIEMTFMYCPDYIINCPI